MGGFPTPTQQDLDDLAKESRVATPPDLYETTWEERFEAGRVLRENQSVQEGWQKLEKKGYVLARRTPPQKKEKP
jgi:hypothetical protein